MKYLKHEVYEEEDRSQRHCAHGLWESHGVGLSKGGVAIGLMGCDIG